MAPFEEWTLPTDKTPEAGDVFEVVMRTVRDSEGIHYTVDLGLRSRAADAYEQGEDQIGAWSLFIPFGQTDATCSGGYAFVRAARLQQEVADKWAVRVS